MKTMQYGRRLKAIYWDHTLIILMIWYNTSSKTLFLLAFIHSSGVVPCWLVGGKCRFKALEIDKTFIGRSQTMQTVAAVTEWERCQQGHNILVTNWASSIVLWHSTYRQLAAYSYLKKTKNKNIFLVFSNEDFCVTEVNTSYSRHTKGSGCKHLSLFISQEFSTFYS